MITSLTAPARASQGSHADELNGSTPDVAVNLESPQLLPSGTFLIDHYASLETPKMYNPSFFHELSEENPIESQVESKRSLRARYGNIVTVSESSLTSYAEMITRVRADFCLTSLDGVIVPLCGALRPASLLAPMGNFDLHLMPIPFTRGSSGEYDKQILNSLAEQLSPLLSNDPLRLAILDTGIGGQSLIHLVKLLRKLHDEASPLKKWSVDCAVIVSDDNRGYLDKTNKVKDQQNERFVISRTIYPTQSLICEDKHESLGYRVDWGNPGIGYIEPTKHRGAVVIESDTQHIILPTENIATSVDRQIARSTTEHLLQDQNIFIGNIWDQELDSNSD